MIRRLFTLLLALCAFSAPARAKDDLVLAMTQMPGTWNPLISSMLAKSLIANMTARAAYTPPLPAGEVSTHPPERFEIVERAS